MMIPELSGTNQSPAGWFLDHGNRDFTWLRDVRPLFAGFVRASTKWGKFPSAGMPYHKPPSGSIFSTGFSYLCKHYMTKIHDATVRRHGFSWIMNTLDTKIRVNPR
jgi:hypothetical protein